MTEVIAGWVFWVVCITASIIALTWFPDSAPMIPGLLALIAALFVYKIRGEE